jgi:hypothetical protein
VRNRKALTTSGSADRLELTMSGASRCDGRAMQTRVATAVVSAASAAMLRVSESLVVNASGASVVEYLGDPVVQADTSGNSIVRRGTP